MPSEDELLDAVEYWHLKYEGPLEFSDFMMNEFDWTRMEFEYWAVTGKTPGDPGNG